VAKKSSLLRANGTLWLGASRAVRSGAGGGVCTMLPRPEIVFDLGLAA
jgi:hypothetical protein